MSVEPDPSGGGGGPSIGYGLDALGTETSVSKVQVSGLKEFQRLLAVPNNCVLAIYGDVKTVEVKAAVKKAFAK